MEPDPKAAGERCGWCGEDPLYVAYHDEEWGRPCFDESRLFEFLVLEGMQAGLAWITILRKRESMRAAFANFDPEVIAHYGEEDRERLLQDPGIIRNRAKVDATIGNARIVLELRDAGGGLSDFLWSEIEHRPIQNAFRRLADVPATTPVAESLSRRLRKRGFRFVGPTICYALMQAIGMVNDHLIGCPAHAVCAAHDRG